MGFGYLPSNVTVATLPDYRSEVEELTKRVRAGRHKIMQLLKYLDKGFSGLLHKNSVENLLDLGTIDGIVRTVETDSRSKDGKENSPHS